MAETSIRFKVETRDANKKVAQLERQVRKLEVAVVKAGGTTRTAGAGFKAFGSSAQAASVGVKGFGAALSTALGPVTAVVAAVGGLSQVFGILKAQDFAEAKVRTLGVNSEELKAQLAGVSRELSGQASVLDLTSAAYDVASAGFNNAADASLILKAASQGATGGFSDLNTVGDATTSVLNAYGLEADKAAKLVDGFIQTQNDGKIVIGEYAANIAKVAPVAAALGVPLEEVNAAVAQITAGGQGAEVTFTALKTAFAQVAAGKVGKEFEALGIKINASTLKSDGLAGTLEKIKKSGADAGTVIKAFGTEAGPSILALLNNTEKYNKLLENQKNAQGAASKAAFEASDTIEGSIKRLSTAFQNIFSDGSELGLLLKSTFQVAAVTVEVFGVAIKATLAPFRAIIGAVSEIHLAIASALGVTGVNVAFELEKAYQQVLGVFLDISNFVVGLGVQLGRFIGAQVTKALDASKSIRDGILNAFGGVFEKVAGFIRNAYNLIPEPIRKFIEGQVSGAQTFIAETVALGKGVTGGAPTPDQIQQPTAQNNISQTGGGLTGKASKEKLDMSEKMLELNRKLRKESELGNEREVATLQLMIDRQKIVESNLTPVKEINALEEATFKFRKKVFALDKKISDQKEANAKKLADDAEKARENDPLVQMQKELDKLVSKETQALHAATSIGNAFTDAFGDVITGTKSVSEAGADMLKSIASDFLAMAKKIIAQQLAMILYQTILNALGGGNFNSAAASPGGSAGVKGIGGGMTNPFGNTSSFGTFAEGGYVNKPTNALIGEGGEPEYVIPASKMRESMSRYSRGSRGGGVIPSAGGSSASGDGGVAVAAPIDVRYTVERINSVDYVTADQFQSGMRQAADQGAKQGEQQTLKRLQMSSGTRKRLGM